MNYLIKKIESRIEILESIGDSQNLLQYYQARFESLIALLLGFLWNKGLKDMNPDDLEYIYSRLNKPSIGTIIEICRKLDSDNLLLGKSTINFALTQYPQIRNEQIGHGYVFQDGSSDVINILTDLTQKLTRNVSLFKRDMDLILVLNENDKTYVGLNFKPDGMTTVPWTGSKEIQGFKINSLYALLKGNEYVRLSPFVKINDYGNSLYIFSSLEEYLLGRVKYNRIVETGKSYEDWDEFVNVSISDDGLKNKSINGTIRNNYENNFQKYIDIGIKGEILKFLKTNKSSVSATIWGHGGVGKTATIQSICEDLSTEQQYRRRNNHFDYILFLSAKDRKYDFLTGKIKNLDDNISTCDDLVLIINTVVFGENDTDPNRIIFFEGKMLIVIDDFETFPTSEKDKITDFVLKLNVNHHKVIITTRANVIVGQEFQTNELTKEKAVEFLLQVIDNEEIAASTFTKDIIRNNKSKVFEITSGRPIFIYQLAFLIGKKGFSDSMSFDIKKSISAINFLYGRIYDYLGQDAKRLFTSISLLVTAENLSNVLAKAQYVINADNDPDKFSKAANDLAKLKIIELDEDRKIFKVYSKEILGTMQIYFEKMPSQFKRNAINRRNQVNKDRNKDIDYSLLNSANANRLIKNEAEVIDSYKQILNRPTASIDIKLQAGLNLCAYLINERGRRLEALEILNSISHQFLAPSNADKQQKMLHGQFTKMWATYNWANGNEGQKSKAVDILGKYVAGGVNYNDDLDLELAGMLLQFRSILLINDWQNLKNMFKYKEISRTDFSYKRNKQKIEGKEIYHRHGNHLYRAILPKKLSDISSAARQNIITGFYNYIDVLVRIEKYDLASKICDFVMNVGPRNFYSQFKRKKDWVESINTKNRNSSTVTRRRNYRK
jgi:GTPase SAR1 family protein